MTENSFGDLNPPYGTVLADPPWPSMHQRATYHRGKPERHYPTMTVDEIAEMKIASLVADNAHLWIWGVGRCLDAAYLVARAWGFVPMSLLTWCKPGPGMGYYLRNNTEHCLLATKGNPMVPPPAARPTSWHVWPRRAHSVKPHELFPLIEGVSPGPRLELFARTRYQGWDAWGTELADG